MSMRNVRVAVGIVSVAAVLSMAVGVRAQGTAQQTVQTKEDLEFLKGTVPLGTPGLLLPRVTREVKPRYTPEAMKAKLQGSTTVQIVVDAKGAVARGRVLESDHPEFGDLALEAARAWRFEPATLDGKAVSVAVMLALDFKLK